MSDGDATKKYDDMTKEERELHDGKERKREQEEQAGEKVSKGWVASLCFCIDQHAALPYSWTQELETITVTVPLPEGTRGRDCDVLIEKQKLKARKTCCPAMLTGAGRAQEEGSNTGRATLQHNLYRGIFMDRR